MSGRLWQEHGIRRYYLHRWPSQRSMKRARARVKALTDHRRVGVELKDTVGALNLVLRGWGFHDQGLHRLLGTVRYPKAA
jgi:RNA-directed DNA polymerase